MGETYTPLGGTEFGSIIEQLRANPPDAIFNTLYGESNVAFFQQMAEEGFSALDLPIMSATIAEEEIRIIGPALMEGYLTTRNYYQTYQSSENFAFVTAYKDAYGQERVTSAPIQNAYAGVHLWKELVEKVNTTDVEEIRAIVPSIALEYIAPAGPVQIDGI